MDVLISIKPKYVKKIISKEKKYEFRKNIFKKNVDTIIIYSTSPEKKIEAYFKLNEIIKDTPKNLWKRFSKEGGISEEEFFEYFKDKDEGYALKIDDLKILDESIDTDEIKDFKAPQNYFYVNKEELLSMKNE